MSLHSPRDGELPTTVAFRRIEQRPFEDAGRMSLTRNDLVFVRDADGVFTTRQMAARAVRRGSAVRIARGVYAPATGWAAEGSLGQYRLLIHSVVVTRRVDVVVSHWSAAAIHGLPRTGGWPQQVHVTQDARSTTRSRGIVVRHNRRLGPEDIVSVGGIPVTTVARTVLDLATITDFRSSVVAADGALYQHRIDRPIPGTTREELMDAWQRAHPFRGEVRAFNVVQFAASEAQTPLESVSRVTMSQIGCPAPTLQRAYFDDDGFIGECDFSWPELAAIGEADGRTKYLNFSKRSGKSIEQVFLEEKMREDRLRAVSRSFGRWDWETANDPQRLHAKLASIGIPMPPLRSSIVPSWVA